MRRPERTGHAVPQPAPGTGEPGPGAGAVLLARRADDAAAPDRPAPASGVVGPVLVIGTGLIGTSVALSLRHAGIDVLLEDEDPAAVHGAVERGAGMPFAPGGPPAELAVLAVPPASTAPVLLDAQRRGLARFYTDVASVKREVLDQARALGCDMASYVPGHPIAGRARSGPRAAEAGLFSTRTWVLCSSPASFEAVAAVCRMVRACGARPVELDAETHDRALAIVSHAPHLVSSAVAATVAGANGELVSLAGDGMRDVTRLASGDTDLWADILSANAGAVAGVLRAVAADLLRAADDLAERHEEVPGVYGVLERGQEGRKRIEHG